MKSPTTEAQKAEQAEARRKHIRRRLLNDFEFYARKTLMIRTKTAEVVPLVLNEAQREFLDQVLEQWQRRGYVRLIILKARQLGLSTVIGGFLYWWISQHKATKGIVVTHKGEASTALFTMTKRFHQLMKPFLKPATSKSNSRELVFENLDSAYMISTAGADTVGRGETLQLAHLSEVGLWPKGKAKEILNGLLQAVPNVKDTFVFIESTARGMSGPFYETWQNAVEGEKNNGFEQCFLPWFKDAAYVADVPEGFTRLPAEEELAEKVKEQYGETLTDAQLMYRRLKVNLDGIDLWNQEYPTFPEDAFLTSGTPVFNLAYLSELMEAAPEPKHRMDFDVISERLEPNPRGRLVIYREHDPHETYSIGADVAGGVSGGTGEDDTLDYSVATVLDSKKRLVAIWRGQVDPDYYAKILYAVGEFYNFGRLAVEINNHGILPNTRLYKDMAYPNLYTREVYDKTNDVMKEELGFYTDVRTRPLIIDELRQAVRERQIELNDKTTLREMMTFVADPKTGKIEHEQGCHDDCVFALAIANHIHEGNFDLIVNEDDFYFEMTA